MTDTSRHVSRTLPSTERTAFRARVLDGPWTLTRRGLVVAVEVLEGEARAPVRLTRGGRAVAVSRPPICFGPTPDPYPVDLLLHDVGYVIAKGDELVGSTP